MRIIFCLLMLSSELLAFELSTEKIILALALGLSRCEAMNINSSNCTNFSYAPYTFTDNQTEDMAWVQISTGIFAIASIFNAWLAQRFFHKKAEHDRAEMLEERIDFLKPEIARLKNNKEQLGELYNQIERIYGR